jgi:ribosome-binding factor A
MTGNPARQARIASQIQRALVLLLRRGVKDPRVGNVTVTAVTLASDLTSATVHVLPFAARGTDAPAMLAGLESAAGYLRSQLARELKLRHVPRLQFQLDEQIERAHHLTTLIDHAIADDAARAQESEPGGQEPGTRRPSEE